jgi:hypothetical protein
MLRHSPYWLVLRHARFSILLLMYLPGFTEPRINSIYRGALHPLSATLIALFVSRHALQSSHWYINSRAPISRRWLRWAIRPTMAFPRHPLFASAASTSFRRRDVNRPDCCFSELCISPITRRYRCHFKYSIGQKNLNSEPFSWRFPNRKFLQFVSVGHISRNASRQTITVKLSSWKKKHSSQVSYGNRLSPPAHHTTNWRFSTLEHDNCRCLPTLWCNPWEELSILDSNLKSWLYQVAHRPITIRALVSNIAAFAGHNRQACDLSVSVFVIVSFTNSHHMIDQLTRSWICRSTAANEFWTRNFIKITKSHAVWLTHNF